MPDVRNPPKMYSFSANSNPKLLGTLFWNLVLFWPTPWRNLSGESWCSVFNSARGGACSIVTHQHSPKGYHAQRCPYSVERLVFA